MNEAAQYIYSNNQVSRMDPCRTNGTVRQMEEKKYQGKYREKMSGDLKGTLS